MFEKLSTLEKNLKFINQQKNVQKIKKNEYAEEFISIINLIRNENIKKAEIVKLPLMNKNHLKFSENYVNFYQYLYIFLDELDSSIKKKLLNTIVNIAYLFDNR